MTVEPAEEQTDDVKGEEPDASQKESGAEEKEPGEEANDVDAKEGEKNVEEKGPPVLALPKEFQQGPTMKPYPSGPTSTSANLAELDNLLEALNLSAPSEESAVGSDKSPRTHQGMAMSPSHTANMKALLSELDSVIKSDPKAEEDEGPTPRPESKVTTSTATKELDALMASLSDFKVSQGKKVAAAGAKPQIAVTSEVDDKDGEDSEQAQYAIPQKLAKSSSRKEIDTMLGTLQSDITAHGVDTMSKGVCPACKKAIAGQVVTALGATWHPEHFTCLSCNVQLSHQTFFERDGRPYCEKDYHDLFSPRCAYCNGPVLDSCITAMGKTWHPDHFFCSHCGRPFGTETFHEKEGKAFCEEDYFELFAPRCGACNKPIMEGFVSAINQQWHTECFVCWACKQPFAGGNFFEHEKKPFCEFHYHERRGSLCYGCHKPILGRCITAMSRKFHPEHFVCAFCLKQLNKGTFKESHDKPYCHPCFIKLFG
jgi:paxillin